MNNKDSKELDNILTAIGKWVKKHDGNVGFVGSFHAFDEKKDFEIFDDRILAFGPKELILMDLKELAKEVKKETDDFVNW